MFILLDIFHVLSILCKNQKVYQSRAALRAKEIFVTFSYFYEYV